MSDREKVVEGLMEIVNFFDIMSAIEDRCNELKQDAENALALLKDQGNGEWLFDRPGHWKCSECGYLEGRIALTEFRQYCPFCGARMVKRNA